MGHGVLFYFGLCITVYNILPNTYTFIYNTIYIYDMRINQRLKSERAI